LIIMSKQMLTKQFFEDNPVKEISAQRLVYSHILYKDIDEITSNVYRKFDNRADEEKEILLKEESLDVLLKMMRGKSDNLNQHLLHQKILENEDILIPQIIEMLKTSGNDVFIENAVKVIAKTRINYCDCLYKILDNIRSPYALSLVCIDIGFLGNEHAVPFLIKKHRELKHLYENENYDQGPLLALIELRERLRECLI